MSYYIVRVNTPNHPTIASGMADMAKILGERGYWRKSSPVFGMEVGTPIIAVGGHGGRGLFLHGIVRSPKWKKVKGGAEGDPAYQWKLGVQWDYTVYMHKPEMVEAVLGLAGVTNSNLRAFTTMTHQQYRDALAMVLSGQPINPWEWTEEEEAA